MVEIQEGTITPVSGGSYQGKYITITNEDDAEDIVQGQIYDFWKHFSPHGIKEEQPPQFTTSISLEVFLYNSVRNRCLNHLKHKKVEAEYIEKIAKRMPGYHLDDDDQALFAERTYRMLFESIDMLPSRSREVFLLYLKGMKNQDIANNLGISLETVKTHKKRSMSFLREKLDRNAFILLILLLPY